ncbi:MAG: transporter [Chitinophagales bacterium]
MKNLLTFVFFLSESMCMHAQDLEARSYSLVPKGMHAAALSYTYSKGNIISDFASPIQDLQVNTSSITMVYVQTFTIFNKLARIQGVMPYSFLRGTAKFYGADTSGSRNGFLDGKIKFGLNLIGSPVLSPKEFHLFQEHTVLGVSIVVSAPIGQYFPEKLINLGTNRWAFKPEIGFSHRGGRLYYEFYTGVWFFTANNEFLQKSSLDQKPLLSLQAHVDYVFKSSIWVAVNGGLARGGESSINDIEQDDQQRNWRLGTTFSMPINKHQSIKAMVNTGVATRAGQDYTAITLVYQYIWF